MHVNGRSDRVKSKPGTDFQSMRKKARAGGLRGKQYTGDMKGLSTSESVSRSTKNVADEVIKKPINSPMSNNDPATPFYPLLRKPGFKNPLK